MRILLQPAAALVFTALCGSAFAQQILPDAGRLLEGTRAAPKPPAQAADISVDAPLRAEPRTPPPRRPASAEPKPDPDEVAAKSGPFNEKDLLSLVSGILGKDVTAEQLREMRAIAMAIVACYQSPACAQFAKQMLAASGMSEELKGGVAAAKPKPKPEQRFKVAGFRFTGVSAFEEQKIADLVKEYAGQDLTFDEMKDAAALVEEYYRKEGYFLARAFVPQQSTKDGVIEIAVLEGRLGDVKLQQSAESRLRPGVAEGILADARSGALVDESSLERALLLLSDIPGSRVRSTLSPGTQVGTADLHVEVEDTGQRVSGSIEGDNFGAKYSGENRFAASLNVINPSGYGDIFGLRVLKSFGEETTTLGRLSYALPVGPWGTRIGANYTQLEYAVGGVFENLQSRGDAKVTSLFVQHPIIRTRNTNLYGYVGYDHKKLMDRYDSIEVTNPRTSDQLMVGLSGELRDNRAFVAGEGGITSFSVMGAWGDLKFQNANQFAADQANTGRKTAGSDFGKLNFNLTRLQTIVPDWTALFSLTGQVARKNLDSSERISVGGPQAVRAYPVGELPSDEALIFNSELRWAWRTEALPGELGVFGFYDWARATFNREPRPSDKPNSAEINGYGFGLSWNRPSDFSVRLTVAFRPPNGNVPTADLSGSSNNSRIWMQAVKWW
jgi:hemolysin activation/secretion protein